MTTAGPNICGTGSNVNDGGARAWGTPTYIQADDASYAYVDISVSSYPTSRRLRAQNFGFAIPAGATITNVSFTYEHDTTTQAVTESSIKLLDADGLPTGNEKASGTWSTSVATSTRSGDGTYWGVTLTPTLVNDADFGLMLKVAYRSRPATVAVVDYVSCTVTYTVGGVGLIGKGLCGSSPLISRALAGRIGS